MADLSDVDGALNFADIAQQLFSGLFADGRVSSDALRETLVSADVQGHGAKLKATALFFTWVATELAKLMVEGEEFVFPFLVPFVGPQLTNMFGAEINAQAFASRANNGDRNAAAKAIVDAFMSSLAGDSDGPIDPGDEGARRVATASVQASLEGWFMGAVPQILSEILGFEGIGHFKEFTELPEDVIGALGIGRLVRRALGPLVHATATVPMTWATNQKYRPTKLPASTAVREYVRGRLDRDQLTNQLARDGYRDEDMDALISEQRKFLNPEELGYLVDAGLVTIGEALQTVRDAGWDEQTGSKLVNLYSLKRVDGIHRELAGHAITAYAANLIDDASLASVLEHATPSDADRAAFTDVAQLRRGLNVRRLTPQEARLCVLAGILAVSDYRRALDLEGYLPSDADALELLLRKELDDKRTADEHRHQLAADRAAAAAAKAQAAAAKKAEIDAARALKQRGSIAALEQAYIRGLIPIERLAEVLAPDFDADTVRIYLADVEDRRHVYVAQQQHAADAAKRAANRGLTVGELQQALVEGVLTVDEIRPQLVALGLSEADVSVLLHVMQDAAAAKAHAAALRAKAEAKAHTKTLSLAQAEALVKAGHWTLPQFDAFLRAVGYDAADVVALHSLVADAVAKAKAAAGIVAGATAANGEKGLTLAQMRRGVVLGTVDMSDFQQFLISQRYSAAAIATLVADVQDAANTAQAAQARRDAAAPASDGRGVSLATLTRAAQLGILSTGDYTAALQARGFSDADVALELDLLAAEIAAAHTPTPAAGSAEATLGAGAGTPTDSAKGRHVQVDGELAARGLSLATVEKSVKAGDTTIGSYTNWLEANGYGHGDAEILTALLAASLPG